MRSYTSVPANASCCRRNTLASLKTAQQAGDEWALLYKLQVQEGKQLDEAARTAAAAKAAALKQARWRRCGTPRWCGRGARAAL